MACVSKMTPLFGRVPLGWLLDQNHRSLVRVLRFRFKAIIKRLFKNNYSISDIRKQRTMLFVCECAHICQQVIIVFNWMFLNVCKSVLEHLVISGLWLWRTFPINCISWNFTKGRRFRTIYNIMILRTMQKLLFPRNGNFKFNLSISF